MKVVSSVGDVDASIGVYPVHDDACRAGHEVMAIVAVEKLCIWGGKVPGARSSSLQNEALPTFVEIPSTMREKVLETSLLGPRASASLAKADPGTDLWKAGIEKTRSKSQGWKRGLQENEMVRTRSWRREEDERDLNRHQNEWWKKLGKWEMMRVVSYIVVLNSLNHMLKNWSRRSDR